MVVQFLRSVIVSSLISSNEPLIVIVFPCPFPYSLLKVLPRLWAVASTPRYVLMPGRSDPLCAGVTPLGEEKNLEEKQKEMNQDLAHPGEQAQVLFSCFES